MSCASALRVLSRLFGFSHTKQQHLKEQKNKINAQQQKDVNPLPCSSLNIIVVDLNSKSSPSFLIFLIIPTISFDNIKRKEARYANKACLSIYLSVPTLTTLDWMIIKFKKKKTTSSPIFSLEYLSKCFWRDQTSYKFTLTPLLLSLSSLYWSNGWIRIIIIIINIIIILQRLSIFTF